jgi:nicotinamide-nucleotide amidase
MKTSLLIIGDEVLNGTTQDTNSRFISRILHQSGLPVSTTLVTGDSFEGIFGSLNYLFSFSDLVISTGGLGPTRDDITKTAVARYFDCEMVFNDNVYEHMKNRFEKRNIPLNKLNQGQAMVPELATVFSNPVGTAPVLWIEKNGKTLVTLPGVPSETEFLIQHEIINVIREKFLKEKIVQRNILTIGIAESIVAQKIEEVENEIEKAASGLDRYKIAYLPDMNLLKLQITGIGQDEDKLKANIDYFVKEIKERLSDYIYGYDNDVFASYMGRLLMERKATVSTAESCTGGFIAHLITSVTGSSEWFTGGIVSYTNQVKKELLHVKEKTLDKYSAVSEETLQEMLDGCLKEFGTTYAIAVTGLAGPTTDASGKEIGEIWIGVADKYHSAHKRVQYDRSRLQNIQLASIKALDMLRRLILGLEV